MKIRNISALGSTRRSLTTFKKLKKKYKNDWAQVYNDILDINAKACCCEQVLNSPFYPGGKIIFNNSKGTFKCLETKIEGDILMFLGLTVGIIESPNIEIDELLEVEIVLIHLLKSKLNFSERKNEMV